jgi:hypothetical protein
VVLADLASDSTGAFEIDTFQRTERLKPMRKTQKKAVHRVDVREPLEKLSLLNTKQPGQSAADVKKTGSKARGARSARWM